jgi:hypothetical protein
LKKGPLFILLVGALAGVVWYLSTRPPGADSSGTAPHQSATSAANPAQPTQPQDPAPGTTAASGGESASGLASGSAASGASTVPATPFLLGTPDTSPAMEPATVLSNMRVTVNQYGSMFGGNPVGTNPEITRALNGDNPKQVRFIKEESGLRINGRGELVDYWGTPFFFHQLSGTEMEIRSAGPDKMMWTADDLITR